MGTLVRIETLAHRIGTDGRISVKSLSGRLRVQGADGDEARLTVSYRIRAGDQAAAERALETGRVIVDRGPSWLEVETPERRISTGLAWLFGGARVGADISLEVPWGTKVRVETMSGSIEASSLVGDQKYRTVSGYINLWGLGGLVEASSISGQVTLDDGGDVRLRASSVSGSVKARARRFYGMTVNTTSGGIAVVGALDPSGDYRADSISGSVSLTPTTGVTAELRTISGGMTSELDNRIEGGRGFWRAIVGDGRTYFKVNSTSGGLRILAPGPEASPARPGPADSVPGTAEPGSAAADSSAAEGGDRLSAEEAWTADESQEPPAASGEPAAAGMGSNGSRAGGSREEIDVLRALERGEISVDEAAARLERARRSGDA
jgi:hypothetical protein